MDVEFSGEIWFWKGPSPFHFVTVPEPECDALNEVSPLVSYGWGMIPVTARIGQTKWKTSLFPKNGGYIVPLRDSARSAERLTVGDVVEITLNVSV